MADLILNQEFRDMAAQADYPFNPGSSLEASGGLVLDRGLLLDALFYPIEDRTAPYYLYSARGPAGDATGVRLTINDSSFRLVGTCNCTLAGDSALCLDSAGRIAGVVVYDNSRMTVLSGALAGAEVYFDKENTSFCAGCCLAPSVSGSVRLECQAGSFTGDVKLTAAGGFTWAVESGGHSLNLYGEMRTLQVPLKSINGLQAEHLWISAYPGKDNTDSSSSSESSGSWSSESSESSGFDLEAGSDIRVAVVQTGAVQALKIGKARDFGYGE